VSRYLVTGGSGRLGTSVVAALAAAGHEVVSVDREPSSQIGVEQVTLDLLDAAATAGLVAEVQPHGIVHLAAIAVPFTASDPVMFATNTALAMNVLDAAVGAGTGQLLMASSPTVIGYGAPGGWMPRSIPIDEEHPTEPWNGYALSKLAVEQIAAMAARQHGDALRIGAFRPCFVISPDEWRGAPTQQGHTVHERLDDPALSAVALFNYVDARDAAAFTVAWTRGAASIPNGSVFFVGAADSLVEAPLADALGEYLPGASVPHDVHAVFSCAKAERMLGWRPTRSWTTELVREHG
jgi:nucleoside-diphosphate-sugar epimerase